MTITNRSERIKTLFIAALASSALLLGCDRPGGADAQAPTSQDTPTSAGQIETQKQPAAETAPKAPANEAQPTDPQKQPTPAEAQQDQRAQPEANPSGAKAPSANQRGQQANPGTQVPTAGAKITDDDLEAFVDLAPRVQNLENTYRARLNEAESAEEANKIRKEAHLEVKREFDESPLEPEEFSTIAARITADPKLQQRAQSLASQ